MHNIDNIKNNNNDDYRNNKAIIIIMIVTIIIITIIIEIAGWRLAGIAVSHDQVGVFSLGRQHSKRWCLDKNNDGYGTSSPLSFK